MFGRFEPHCHLTGLLTASDAVALCEQWPIAADVAVPGGGQSVLTLARQGEQALQPYWCMRPVPTGNLVGLSAWQRFQAYADVASHFLVHPGENPRRAQSRLFGVSEFILQRAVQRWQQQSVVQAEVRVHLGAASSTVQPSYADHVLAVAQRLSHSEMKLRIRFTLPRVRWQHVAERVLPILEHYQAYWAGWDWSGEEVQPESGLAFAALPAPLTAGRSIHAGEQLAHRPWLDAVRHCHAAIVEWGGSRLGHGSVLGLEPLSWLGRRWHWNGSMAGLASQWIEQYFPEEESEFDSLLAEDGIYSAENCELMSRLLEKVCDIVRQQCIVCEVCPTSNARIVGGTGFKHPLPGLLSLGINVIIGSDDPGILGTTLPQEQQRARQLGWMGS